MTIYNLSFNNMPTLKKKSNIRNSKSNIKFISEIWAVCWVKKKKHAANHVATAVGSSFGPRLELLKAAPPPRQCTTLGEEKSCLRDKLEEQKPPTWLSFCKQQAWKGWAQVIYYELARCARTQPQIWGKRTHTHEHSLKYSECTILRCFHFLWYCTFRNKWAN